MRVGSVRFSHLWACLPAFFLVLVAPVNAAGLNDTGITTCYNDSTADAPAVAADSGSYPRQDCRYGRDAAAKAKILSKIGSGPNGKGFDFTKIGNNGLPVSNQNVTTVGGSADGDWACTKDNVTGLLWEVKTTSGLRSKDQTYTWYRCDNPRTSGVPSVKVCDPTNGGFEGYPSAPTDRLLTCFTSGSCDTEKYAKDVNNSVLCGAGFGTSVLWRVPTRIELGSIVDYSSTSPSIDTGYFPNTPAAIYWTNTADSTSTPFAWSIYFSTGVIQGTSKATPSAVRLVAGPFP